MGRLEPLRRCEAGERHRALAPPVPDYSRFMGRDFAFAIGWVLAEFGGYG